MTWIVVAGVLVLLLGGLGFLGALGWQLWRRVKTLGREAAVVGQRFEQLAGELERLSATAEAPRDADAPGQRPGAAAGHPTGG